MSSNPWESSEPTDAFGSPTTGAYGPGASGTVPPSVETGPKAGFWIRFGAVVIDSILVVVVYLILALALKSAGSILGLVFIVAYYIYLEGSRSGQTIGKRIVGIRVVSSRDGGPIGYGPATGRFFARIISQTVIYLGYFWMLWDRRKQTWHDKLCGSVVVPVDAYPVAKWPNG